LGFAKRRLQRLSALLNPSDDIREQSLESFSSGTQATGEFLEVFMLVGYARVSTQEDFALAIFYQHPRVCGAPAEAT
jgi:hypothetical protein